MLVDGNGTAKTIFAYYALTGLAGDTVDLSVWRKTLNSAPPGAVFARVVFRNNDGTNDINLLLLNTGNMNAWEQFTDTFVAAKDYNMITLSLVYGRSVGTIWYDDISLQIYHP